MYAEAKTDVAAGLFLTGGVGVGSVSAGGFGYTATETGLGMLFGNKSTSHNRNELIIFMTPHVIFDESDLIEASNELRDRVKKLQKYVKVL